MAKEKYTKEYILNAIEDYISEVAEAKGNEPPIFETLCARERWSKSHIYEIARQLELEGDSSLMDILDVFQSVQVSVFSTQGLLNRYNAAITKVLLAKLGFTENNNISLNGTLNNNIKNIGSSVDTRIAIAIALLEHDIGIQLKLAKKQSILDTQENFILLNGGRGGGKSELVARYTLLKALKLPAGSFLLCGREIQRSIKQSVRAMLVRLLNEYGMLDLFNVAKDEICCLHNNNKIIFLGLKSATSEANDTLKSTDNLRYAWIEEAQTISSLSIEKLVPTVSRNDNYQIVFTYNRNKVVTIVHDYFIKQDGTFTYPEKTLNININYWENKFLNDETISLANLDKVNNLAKWKYIWGGEPQTDFEGALWDSALIKDMHNYLNYDHDLYKRRIIAVDPAMESKDFNNEYGIIILGLTYDDVVHVIDDRSGHYKPAEYAREVSLNYHKYDCDAFIYESNQGGEHVAQTVLGYDPKVRPKAVRARHGKYERALPAANASAQGRIYLLRDFPKLEDQMLLLTSKGYQGLPGESPDRLDAFVWGVYELLGLKDIDAKDTYFRMSYFLVPEKEYTVKGTFAFLSVLEGDSVLLICDNMFEGKYYDDDYHILIKKIEVMETVEIKDKLNNLLIKYEVSTLYVKDNNSLDIGFLKLHESIVYNNISDEIKVKNLNELALKILPITQQGFVRISADVKPVISSEITQYNPEANSERAVLRALAEYICYAKGLLDV